MLLAPSFEKKIYTLSKSPLGLLYVLVNNNRKKNSIQSSLKGGRKKSLFYVTYVRKSGCCTANPHC